MTEDFKQIVLREKERKLLINRLPKEIRSEFVALANEEFCEDYGMAFKHVWDTYKTWIYFMNNFDIKLDLLIRLLSPKEEKPAKEQIKFLSGRRVDKEVKDE